MFKFSLIFNSFHFCSLIFISFLIIMIFLKSLYKIENNCYVQKTNSIINVYITGLLPRDFRETHMRNKTKKVNKLIREKCSSISTPWINYIKQDHDWIDKGNSLRIKYYYRDCLHLVELGNKNVSNTIIKAIKHSSLAIPMNTIKIQDYHHFNWRRLSTFIKAFH